MVREVWVFSFYDGGGGGEIKTEAIHPPDFKPLNKQGDRIAILGNLYNVLVIYSYVFSLFGELQFATNIISKVNKNIIFE